MNLRAIVPPWFKIIKLRHSYTLLQFEKDLLYWIFTKSIKTIIERTSKEVVFPLPSSTGLEDLQDIADLFIFKEISRKSKATQKDVDELVNKIKKGRWAKTKRKLGL